MIEIVFKGINWWGNKVYSTKTGINIIYIKDDGYYLLSDNNDIDSEPCGKLKSSQFKIVDKFN